MIPYGGMLLVRKAHPGVCDYFDSDTDPDNLHDV
jgi:hypothetical protein